MQNHREYVEFIIHLGDNIIVWPGVPEKSPDFTMLYIEFDIFQSSTVIHHESVF